MSMQDTISDMLTRIRNAQQAKHKTVACPHTKLLHSIANVLVEEGFVHNVEVTTDENNHKQLLIELKYYNGRPVIESLKRLSKPSLRIYKSYRDIKPVPGFGIIVLSTPNGVISHRQAKRLKVGGELICEVA